VADEPSDISRFEIMIVLIQSEELIQGDNILEETI